jgi:hypothetical protein
MKDVHTEHCCVLHGCKYGDHHNCTVWCGIAKQSDPCEYCHFQGIDTTDVVESVLLGSQATCPHCGHII